ncbi:MAG TPA: EAL domain-containing protein [Conexibacter sp.]|nr:EAL domain-containing protein [Conexibacter sp.]
MSESPDQHERARHAAEAAVARAGGDAPAAVLLVDAADVQRVDEACGHAAGDAALTALERQLRDAAPATAELARLSREQIVVTTAVDRPAALELAQALAHAARAPLALPDTDLDVRLEATVGLALPSDERGDAAALLHAAATAAHAARGQSGPAWRLADDAVQERALRRLRLEHELAGALTRDELALYFQPIVSLRRGTVIGVEALVRWRHPHRGLLGPAQFLPVAEESGLIVEIGDWVLAAACRQVARWGTSHPERVLPPVSLNVSGRELRDGTFAERFAAAVTTAGVAPEALALEIEDPGVLDERAGAEEALAALRRLGVRIVLDRFGGARSSLADLARLPIDGLKLDRSLLGPLTGAGGARGETAVAEAIVALAQTLGLSITIPGIETDAQLATVRALHADAAQGHLIARPSPASSLADLEALDVELAGDARAAAEGADELLPLSAVAEALGVSSSTVRRLADQGVLPGTRTEGGHRRFRRGDVQRLARERRRTPALRPWELPTQPLPATAELLEHDGPALTERAARALYDPQQLGWFAAPQGIARARTWLGALADAVGRGAPREALATTAAYADAATLGGASAAEVVRFLGQFGAAASHELSRSYSAGEEARALQRIMGAAAEAFLERR